MLVTNLFTVALVAVGVLAGPLEERNNYKAKKCDDYKCVKYWPQCDNDWYPMYCDKGWGDKNPQDYYDGCDKSKVYCCKEKKCYWG